MACNCGPRTLNGLGGALGATAGPTRWKEILPAVLLPAVVTAAALLIIPRQPGESAILRRRR